MVPPDSEFHVFMLGWECLSISPNNIACFFKMDPWNYFYLMLRHTQLRAGYIVISSELSKVSAILFRMHVWNFKNSSAPTGFDFLLSVLRIISSWEMQVYAFSANQKWQERWRSRKGHRRSESSTNVTTISRITENLLFFCLALIQ